MANVGKLVLDLLMAIQNGVDAEKAAVAAQPVGTDKALVDIAISDALYPIASALAKQIVADLKG